VREILGLDSIFAEMITGLGLALVVGNGYAWWKHRRGAGPPGTRGEFRPGRVAFLMGVGVIIAVWGLASIVTSTSGG
jgi:hypothetical protein